MYKYLFLLVLILFSIEISSQERIIPEGFELVHLDGKEAYLNLETGEVKLINSNNKTVVRVESEIVNSDITSTTFDKIHLVKKEETLYQIARLYNISLQDIYHLNNTSDSLISVGQEIIINADNSVNTSTINTIHDDIHIVEKGETLYGLSKTHTISIARLKELNQLNSNTISIGQKLRLR